MAHLPFSSCCPSNTFVQTTNSFSHGFRIKIYSSFIAFVFLYCIIYCTSAILCLKGVIIIWWFSLVQITSYNCINACFWFLPLSHTTIQILTFVKLLSSLLLANLNRNKCHAHSSLRSGPLYGDTKKPFSKMWFGEKKKNAMGQFYSHNLWHLSLSDRGSAYSLETQLCLRYMHNLPAYCLSKPNVTCLISQMHRNKLKSKAGTTQIWFAHQGNQLAEYVFYEKKKHNHIHISYTRW